ncbi:MAG TPA: mandelate racemase/muconate lactonizing enzyme family protein, partial [Clostridia bacterium]|nr:mandelate racemase/muconate lactonizing enzyme family protein [Clostridia bacterium]
MKTNVAPEALAITDLRFCDLDNMPKRCTLLKLYTNAGIVGYGEVRDAATRTYAAMLKSRLLGENPLNVDKLFRRIRQFGHHSRQGGGVSGIEVALMDIAGKYWGVPCWQLLGGRYRDKVRVYCDTDVQGRHSGRDMGLALKRRMDMGFNFLKMDLGIGLLMDEPGVLTAPLGFLEELKTQAPTAIDAPHGSVPFRELSRRAYELKTIAHPFTGIRLTEKGLDILEAYVRAAREVIGWEVPLAIDHFGHVCVEDCLRFARRIEPF